MRTPRLLPALAALAGALVSAQANAAYPFVSSATVAGAVSGSVVNRLVQNPATGDLYAAGAVAAGAGNLNIWIGRYSESLVLLSSYTYDKAGADDAAYGVAVDTLTGNVFATGYVSSGPASSSRDIWLARFSSTLALQSTITVNGSAGDLDEGANVLFSSNTLYVVGVSSQPGGKGVWLADYDTNLVMLSSGNFYQNGLSISDFLRTAGGTFVVGSRAPNFLVSNDQWIGKFSASHVFLASAAVNGPSSNTDHLFSLAEDGSGGVFAVGFVNSATLADPYIARYDSNLVRLASTTFNGPGNGNDMFAAVTRTSSGTFLASGVYSQVAGLGGLNVLISEYDSSLNKLSSTSFTTAGSGNDTSLAVLIGANQDVYAAGYATTGGVQDIWLGRFSTSAAVAPPSGFAGVAQSSSSILWSWTDNSTNETGFRVKSGASSVSGNLPAGTTTWLQTGLTANATSGSLLAQAFNIAGSADSGASTLYSLSDPPNSISVTFYGSSAAFTWPTMTNPPGTRWSVERGTDGVSYPSQLYFSSAAAAFTDTALAAQTTYFYRIRSANGDGVYSFYANASASVFTGGSGYPGCVATNNVGAGQFYATIQAAVDALPQSLAGPSCVVIRDGATYAEQVTVRGFTNNGMTISIFSDPAGGLKPTVAPPAASTAAFVIANASVNISGFDVVGANAMNWGVLASSAQISLSSVNVRDPSGLIAFAGISISSSDSVAYSSIAVLNAHGLQVNGSNCVVHSSTMTNLSVAGAGSLFYALHLNSASGSAFSNLYVKNAAENSVCTNFFSAYLSFSNNNSFSSSLFANNAPSANKCNGALGMEQSSTNTFTNMTFSGGSNGIYLFAGNASSYNRFTQSTITVNGPSSALNTNGGLYNDFSGLQIVQQHPNGIGVDFGGTGNTISSSTIMKNGPTWGAVVPNQNLAAPINSISHSFIGNPGGHGIDAFSSTTGVYQNSLIVRFSTITSAAAGYAAVLLNYSSAVLISNSYLQGASAARLVGSTGTVITYSVLIATDAAGAGLTLTGGNSGLAVSFSTLSAPASGISADLTQGNGGGLSFSNLDIIGGRFGLSIATQAASADIAISSVTFRNLTPGATAISFTGGAVVSTFSAVRFEDASISVNVGAAPLATTSRITMRGASGARTGPFYENDPNSLVDWPDMIPAPPSAFAGAALSTAAILWTWTDNSPNETGYRVMSGAVNLSGDLAANTTTWLQTGLSANATSGTLLARAFNEAGTTDSASVARYALAAAPSGLAASGVSMTSATLSWTSANPAGTLFELERSTGAGFIQVATTTAASYADTGLSAGATYYYRVRALNGDSVATAYSSTAAAAAPAAAGPNAPTGFSGAAQSTTSILWTWTDNSTDEAGFRVKLGGINASGDLPAGATAWLQTGLGVNTSSGAFLAQAFNSTGTADSNTAARYTLAAAPASLAAASVFQTSATITWTAGNPAGTVFQVERSTGAGFALLSTGTAASFADSGLTAASTYWYRVRALNGDSIATAYASSISVVTSPVPPPGAPAGFSGAAQDAFSILWTWADNASNETGYRVMSGAVNLSGDLPAGATQWLQTGLSTNTSYGPYLARAFNAGGTADSGTGSRWTLASVPGAPAAAGISQTAATLGWGGANPAGTTFQLERSTGAGYGLQFAGTATSYLDASLSAQTTYWFRVRALNGEAVATAYSSTSSFVTLPAAPASPGTPAGTALGTSSISWTWALAPGATSYFLYRASNGASLGSSAAAPYAQTGLTPNAAYGLRVLAVNAGGASALSAAATAYTLAAPPTGGAAASITSTTLTASWGLGANPASTIASLERSADAVAYATVAVAAITSYADSGLLGCTTYYYRVRNANGDGVATAYASFSAVTANTVPSPPSGLNASSNAGGKISLSWGFSPTEGVSAYRLYWDGGSGTVSYAAPLAVLTSTEASYTTGVLTSSAAYTFALRAVHRCGTVETGGATAMAGAAPVLAAVRAAIKEPDSGRRVNGNRVTILGELIAGTPSDVQQIVFQYKPAASSAWLDVNEANVEHPNPDLTFPYFVHVDVTGLAPGDYDLRAVAYDLAGTPDSAPPAVRVAVDPVTPDVRETQMVDGKIKKDQTVTNTVTSVVDASGSGAADPAVRVTIPVGAVNSATATVSVIANPAIATAAPAGQSLVGSAIKIDLSNGQSVLNGTAEITLTYPDTVLFPSLLQIYYLNEATGEWSRDFSSTVDTASRTVTGRTPHFSTFALLMGTSFAADLSGVRAYPVPFKPNGSNPDEGRPFSPGDPNSGIIFSNLAAGSEIRIYTMTGRLVASLDSPSPTGAVRWDARNQDGRDVASGAYFAVISAAGQKNVVKKLVIIR